VRRSGVGQGRQRPILRLPWRQVPRLISPALSSENARHDSSENARHRSSENARRGADSVPLFRPFPPPARSQPCCRALSFPQIRVGTGSQRLRFRATLGFEPARGEAAHVF